MLKKLKSILIFVSKEKATTGIKISKFFFKAKVRQITMHWAVCSDVTASCQTGWNISGTGTLQQDPQEDLENL